jgi:hypothetical protein
MRLVVGTNSWLTVDEADEYMETRYGSWEVWTDDTNKEAALITAYKRIVNSGAFINLPSEINDVLKDAQCEMALYIIIEGMDITRRAALQAQGVIQSGITKESYDPAVRGVLAFPPEVRALLKEYIFEGNGVLLMIFPGMMRRM